MGVEKIKKKLSQVSTWIGLLIMAAGTYYGWTSEEIRALTAGFDTLVTAGAALAGAVMVIIDGKEDDK